MASMSAPVQEILAALTPVLVGANTARYAGIAAVMVFSYDHALTFGDEVRFFWSGEWTISRILFLLNRYFPILALAWGLVCFLAPELPPELCTKSIRAIWILTVMAMLIAEAVLVLRIWYLFRHSIIARSLVLFCFFACGIASAIALYFVGRQIEAVSIKSFGLDIEIIGCLAAPSSNSWHVFAPVLVLHTVLYLFTAYRGLHNQSVVAEAAPFMLRLVRDGGILYLVILATDSDVRMNSLMLSLTSVSISRIMLSIRSLAADLTNDPSVLMLNDNELGRVSWRKGPNAGDIIVDMDDQRRLEGAPMAMEIRYERDIQETTSERDIHDKRRGRTRNKPN
ncbi:hypothetical protein FIBSPDRAFT_1021530 [Athelia psychrophila]|uniref:DUF6533 domain-containing protein n=1 Tax=Athelia psychrophila TaxID=1759441 RepID=A0A166JJY2_9AGAM|nr:hypothetical protein FIBSPDRAFT_1021530 [Fibularhizoctonia sp. CBS 109695]